MHEQNISPLVFSSSLLLLIHALIEGGSGRGESEDEHFRPKITNIFSIFFGEEGGGGA